MVMVHPVYAPHGVRPKQTLVPAREHGTPEAFEDGLTVSSSGISSEFPRLMHTLDTAPAKEDGPPDKATEEGLDVSSSGASSELPRLMHAHTNTRWDCLAH